MRFLLDTQVLLWASGVRDRRRSPDFQSVLAGREVERVFSAASIWKVAIKSSLRRSLLAVDPHALRRGLLARDYTELPISSAHTAAVAHLPAIHHDPFDRLLIAQAQVEGITLVTADRIVATYPGPIRLL